MTKYFKYSMLLPEQYLSSGTVQTRKEILGHTERKTGNCCSRQGIIYIL